ncbi:MAG: cytochrome-c peroxidase [Calditrichia bacterium]
MLFYDKKISVNNTIACASCHQQAFAFSDTVQASTGVNGTTGRHSMRLINARFANEAKFFWDERAASLEAQTTMPIQDHAEMGFSGENGDPALDSLLTKLMNIDYYNDLFTFAYGDSIVTEARMQRAIAQFIRSIQSFDSKYDAGRSQVPNDPTLFPNFTRRRKIRGSKLFSRAAGVF